MKKISKLLGIFGIMLVLGIVLVNNTAYAHSNKDYTMDETHVRQLSSAISSRN